MIINDLEVCKTLSDVILLTSDNRDNVYYVFSYKEMVATVGFISFSSTKDYLVGEINEISESFITLMLIDYELEDTINKLRIILTNIDGSKALTVIINKQKVDTQALYCMLQRLSDLFKLDGIYKYE